MEKIISLLVQKYPSISFVEGKTFYWSPETSEVFYGKSEAEDSSAIWSLLHETGHAVLGHKSYQADFELIKLEMLAWEKAKELSKILKLPSINEDHIQDCLDTYRDWLYARSVCPYCNTKSLQQSNLNRYRCFNCHSTWKVTPSRFCRAYRSVKNIKTPSIVFGAVEK